jgi:hypothetical protein
MGRRGICDPFDAAEIVERITAGETTADDAWRAYAATAARPCARATFAGALSRARVSAGLPIAVKHERDLKRGVSGDEIRERAGASPVLVIGPDAALRVRGGGLDVEHGSGKDRVRVKIDVDEPKPGAIEARNEHLMDKTQPPGRSKFRKWGRPIIGRCAPGTVAPLTLGIGPLPARPALLSPVNRALTIEVKSPA